MNLFVAVGMDQDAVLFAVCTPQRFIHDVVVMPSCYVRNELVTDRTDTSLFFPEVHQPCIFKGWCGSVPIKQSRDVIDRLSLGPPRPERSVGRHVLDSQSPYSCLVPLSPYVQGRADRSSYE